jgi:hypothetical protein
MPSNGRPLEGEEEYFQNSYLDLVRLAETIDIHVFSLPEIIPTQLCLLHTSINVLEINLILLIM